MHALKSTLPDGFLAMYDAVTSLPPVSDETLPSEQLQEPGKRVWETSKTGYVNWAVAQLLARTRDGQGEGEGSATQGVVASVATGVGNIGSAENVRGTMLAVTDATGGGGTQERSMDLG